MSRKQVKRRKIIATSLIAGLIMLLLSVALRTVVADTVPPSARQQVANAINHAGDSGQYQYQTTVVQTMHPLLSLENVGRTARTERFEIDGEMDVPADRMVMELTGVNQQSLQLMVENGRGYGRVSADEPWTETELAGDFMSPGGDPLGFLAAIENVRIVDAKVGSGQFPGELLPAAYAESITRYQYELSGQKYAQLMREQMEEYLREAGQLPGGLTLQTPLRYVEMTGQGEIWVSNSAAGAALPVRQMLQVQFPAEAGADHWVSAEIITSFSNWAEPAQLALADNWLEDPLGAATSLTVVLADRLPLETLRQTSFSIGAALIVVGAGAFLLSNSRRRQVRVAINLTLVAIMLAMPLLQTRVAGAQSEQLTAFNDWQQARQTEIEQANQADAEIDSGFVPTESPLQRSAPEFGVNSADLLNPTALRTRTAVTSSCVITATSDCDGDGLTDNVELYELGTRIDDMDSDDDGISDGTEVAPFQINGQDWYLDPLNSDSNGDGLSDGAECLGRTDVITTTLLTVLEDACGDTDADLIPDVHDFDDDGDGVPDSADLAHLQMITVTNQTFGLNISGATADENLFVDFQIRPTDDSRLWWSNSVLNWPGNDRSGQIQRVLTDTLSADGDMQLVPMLEITIPYSATNPSGGLPITGTVPSSAITQTSPLNSWLDTDALGKYGINVILRDNGDRVAYVPLNAATDPNGGSPVAWLARMPYELAGDVSGWGADHQVKQIWLVSGQRDTCSPPPGSSYNDYCKGAANWTSQTEILQTYYDDFIITGMQVQEHNGAEAMMIAQSAATGIYEPDLWHMADTLQQVYLEAQTVNEQRFTLGDIPGTYTAWGIANGALKFNAITGLSDDAALLDATTGDAVPSFLRTSVYTTNPVSGTVASVLLLSEETVRSRSMGDIDLIPGDGDVDPVFIERFAFANNTFAIDLTSAPSATTGAIRLQPFLYTSGIGWNTVAPAALIGALTSELDATFTTPVMNQLLAGDQVSDIAQAKDGAIVVAINYYLSMYLAAALPVVSDDSSGNVEPLVNSDHLRPTVPIAAIVQRQATELKTYFADLTLEDLNIPTVDARKNADAADGWAQLAASRGAVLQAISNVLQGNTASSAALALLELSNFTRSVGGSSLYDARGYAILDTVLGDFIAGTILPENLRSSGPDPNFGQFTGGGLLVGGGQAAFGSVRSIIYLFTYDDKIIQAMKQGPTIWAKKYTITGGIQSFRNTLDELLQKPSTPLVRVQIKNARQFIAKWEGKYSEIITDKVKLWTMSGVIVQGISSGLTITIALATGQVQADSPAFSRLLAEQFGALIVETFIAILSLVAFQAVSFALSKFLVFIQVIDSIMIAICGVFNLDQDENFARWFCNGVTGALAQAIAYVINDTTPLVDMERDDRLNVVFDTPSFGDESGVDGVVVGNAVTLGGNVTNTLYMADPNWMGYIYWFQWTDNFLDDATFEYRVQANPQGIDLDLNGTSWTDFPGKKPSSVSANDARFYANIPMQPLQYTFNSPGVNLGLPVYFSEGFATRQQNCWLIIVTPVCFLTEYDDTNHVALDEQFIFDVLPNTLGDFRALAIAGDDSFRLAWDAGFPTLADADNDGLRSKASGGVDPDDSSADSDGDGLSDYFELNGIGFDATQADSDCDGLTDYWELFYNTNPARADSDGDGLLDGDEFFHLNRTNPYENSTLSNSNAPLCSSSDSSYSGGWEIVYDYDDTGAPLTTLVSADPNDPDSDDDTLTDQQERIYAYNPNVASTLNVLRLDSTIETDSALQPYVSVTGTITYTTLVTNELELPFARGLLEAELPLDSVQERQSLGIIAPQTAVNASGALSVQEAGINSSGPIDLGIRAGAIIEDPTGRVLWLHMNEPADSTSFADSSFLQNDGACAGASCPAATGTELTFDGSDAVVVPDDDSLDLAQYTLALAVKPSLSGTEQFLLSKNSDIGHGSNFRLVLSSADQVRFITFDGCAPGSGFNAINTPVLPMNEWSHISASYNGSTKRLYLNGDLVAATAYSGTACQNDDPVYIGARFAQSGLIAPFTGQIDEVEIYDSVLDAATILARYAEPIVQVDMRDGATWGSDDVSCSGGNCPVVRGSGADFNQRNYLSVDAPDLTGDVFSFATWIRPETRTAPMRTETAVAHGKDSDRDWQGVFGNMVYDGSGGSWPYTQNIYPSLFVSDDGALRMTMANNSVACEVTTVATGLVQNDVWQHLVVSYDGGAFTFYVNGEPVPSDVTGSSCAGITPPSLSTVYVGRPNDYGYAWVDRLRMTDVQDQDTGNRNMEIELNLNSDRESGNIWGVDVLDSFNGGDLPRDYEANRTFIVRDTTQNQWLRLFEHDRNPRNSYDPDGTFWKPAEDETLKQITGIRNDNYLGVRGIVWEGPIIEFSRDPNGILYFGVYNDYFQGLLDDFRIYNYELTPASVAELYNANSVALDLTFDEAPGADLFADRSGNFVTVSCSGGTCPISGVAGRLNQALEFDGIDDYVTIGTSSAELGTSEGDFSVMMWIKPDTFRGALDQGVVPLIEVGDNYNLDLRGYGRLAAVRNGSFVAWTQNFSLYNATQRWYHLAYVFNNGTYTFYVNGENKGVSWLEAPEAASNLRIGVRGPWHFDGLLDDLTVVKRALGADEVQAHLNRAPAVNLHLDEDLSLTSFADDSESRYTATCADADTCPESGDKGQIRESATFDGNDVLTLAATDALTMTDFSVGLWIKPTKTITTPQNLVTKANGSLFDANFRLRLLPDSLTVRFDRQHTCLNSDGNWDAVDASIAVLENQWNHVLATHDATNGEMNIYVNGTLAGTTGGTGSSICTALNPIRLGQGYNGGMDEVAVTPTVLSATDVAALYNYQAAWFDVINQHRIFVDADVPTVDLSLTPTALNSAETVLYIGAEDASSPLESVEYRINGGEWQSAQPNSGDPTTNAAWLFYFQQPAGQHIIEARAADVVGNISPIALANVRVDEQAPALTLFTPSEPIQVGDSQLITGTVSDDFSGVEANTLSLSMVDRNGLLTGGTQPGAVGAGNAWQATQGHDQTPYGIYTATATVEDQAGNPATASAVFQLDDLPPYADVTEGNHFIEPGVAKTLTGVAGEPPYPSDGRTLHLHFESGAGLWEDGSETSFSLLCDGGNCPTSGVPGKRGEAVSFNGVNSRLTFSGNETLTQTTTAGQLGLIDASFTVMGWVKADNWSGNHAVLGSTPAPAADGFYLGIQNGSPILGYGGSDSVMTGTVPTGDWVHVTWRFDATSGERAFFVNGELGSAPTTGHAIFTAIDALEVGRARGGNAFGGLLDELVVYGRALPDETIYDIANPLNATVASLELRVRSFDERDIGQFAGTWTPVTLDTPNALFTTWQHTLPGLAENAYKIDLRVTDSSGNSSFVDGAWDLSVSRPDLSVTKQTGASVVALNDVVAYTITYSNSVNVAATNVVLTEIVPVDSSFNAALSHPDWVCAAGGVGGSECTLAIGTAPANSNGVISFTVTATSAWSPGTTELLNTVSIDGGLGDLDSVDNSSATQTPIDGIVDLGISIGQDGTPIDLNDPNFVKVYTLTYTNTGTQAANGLITIELLDSSNLDLPSLSQYNLDWDCSFFIGWTCTNDVGTVPSGASGAVTFTARAFSALLYNEDEPGVLTAEIADSAGGMEINLGNNSDTVTTPFETDFFIMLSPSSATIPEGQVVTHTAVLSGTGIAGVYVIPLDPNLGEITDFDNSASPPDQDWGWSYTGADDGPDSVTAEYEVIVGAESYGLLVSFPITVVNVAPSLPITGADTIASGVQYNLTLGSVFDPGDDTLVDSASDPCVIEWGDSASEDCFSALNGGIVSHTYSNALGFPTITVYLTDEDGTHVAATKTITITDAPTGLSADLGSVTASESVTLTNTGAYSPPDASYAWSASEGTVTDLGNGLWSWSLEPGGPEGSRTVTVNAGGLQTSFTVDVQGDGAASDLEDGAPNGGDGNNDGTPDSQQMHVASLPSPVNGQYVTLATSPGLTLTNVALTTAPAFGGSPPDELAFPFGFPSFELSGMGAGGSGQVDVILTATAGINTYYKYDSTNGWFEFGYDGDSDTGVEFLDTTISLYLTDGARGDSDLVADGTITDPGGPALRVPTYDLTVATSGAGAVSEPSGSFAEGSIVTLTATADLGWTFSGWSGALSGITATQSVVMDQDTSVTALFTKDMYQLDRNVVGNGVVSSDPEQENYLYGDAVSVTATPDVGWSFSGWSGDLSGSSAIENVTMVGNAVVTATFTQDAYVLTTNTSGNGSVVVDPDQASYVYGDVVSLQAVPDPGYELQNWTGDINDDGEAQQLFIDGDKSVTAIFATAVYSVETTTEGNGSIVLEPLQSTYSFGDVITVTAVPGADWQLANWGLDLSDGIRLTEQLTVTSNASLLAIFEPVTYELDVAWSGDGSAQTQSGATEFGINEVVTVTATADDFNSFLGWRELDSDIYFSTSPTTTVTITADRSIVAVFTPFTYSFDVNLEGPGSGSVAIDVLGVNCTVDCFDVINHGSVISLTASADAGSSFAGWSGDAAGATGTVTLTVTADASVTATFGGATTTCTDVSIAAGWNLLSLPVAPTDANVATLFPNAASPAYTYQNGYSEVTMLEPGRGVWIKFDSAETVNICGARVTDAVPVTAGWNIIGIYDAAVISTSQIALSGGGGVDSPFFSYQNGYNEATSLQPGQGYWVKVPADGTLGWIEPTTPIDGRSAQRLPVLRSARAPAACTPTWEATLTVSDAGGGSQPLTIGVAPGTSPAFDVDCDAFSPPAPPTGAFDGRLRTTSDIDALAEYQGQPGTWIVAFSAATNADPVTVSWDSAELPSGGTGFTIRDRVTGSVVSADMSQVSSVEVPNVLSDLEIVFAGPTAVTLADFSTLAQPGGSVRVTWETATEIDNAGFNLYRSAIPVFDPATATQLNAELIAAQAQFGAGASYVFLDNSVAAGLWYYFLEDVELSGTTMVHGPVSADTSVPTSTALAGLQGQQDQAIATALIAAAGLLLLLLLLQRGARNRRRSNE